MDYGNRWKRRPYGRRVRKPLWTWSSFASSSIFRSAAHPRGHTISTVYIARASGEPAGADDATRPGCSRGRTAGRPGLRHGEIIADYLAGRY